MREKFLIRIKVIMVVIMVNQVVMANGPSLPEFKSKITNIPKAVQKQMSLYTWQPNCPVALNDLRYVQLNFFGFDNKTHTGILIINKVLAKEVVSIFKTLYENRFPIERMQPLHDYHGDDNASMEANNTAAFNCRPVTSRPGEYSQHSYGRAIDINPKINPYVDGKIILPKGAGKFADREQVYPGKITKSSLAYQVFSSHGWDWGGGWFDLQDYQHFEKRVHGVKRNPRGHSASV